MKNQDLKRKEKTYYTIGGWYSGVGITDEDKVPGTIIYLLGGTDST